MFTRNGEFIFTLYNGHVFVYPRYNGSRRASVAQLVCKFKGKFAVIVDGKRSSYVFTRNGEFIFTYRDGAGNEGSRTITVDWIDKVGPGYL